jgi:hypothetical protein
LSPAKLFNEIVMPDSQYCDAGKEGGLFSRIYAPVLAPGARRFGIYPVRYGPPIFKLRTIVVGKTSGHNSWREIAVPRIETVLLT